MAVSVSALCVIEAPGVVVLVVGNESRGDDGLGPALLTAIEPLLSASARVILDFQLQIEHALELVGAGLVLFIDAEVGLEGDYAFREVHAGGDRGVFSHALSPMQVLAVFEEVCTTPAPPAFALGIAAQNFGLGETLSTEARRALAVASNFAALLLREPDLARWRGLAAQDRVAVGDLG